MRDFPSAGFKQFRIGKHQDGVIRVFIDGRNPLEIPEVCIEKCHKGCGFRLFSHETENISKKGSISGLVLTRPKSQMPVQALQVLCGLGLL